MTVPRAETVLVTRQNTHRVAPVIAVSALALSLFCLLTDLSLPFLHGHCIVSALTGPALQRDCGLTACRPHCEPSLHRDRDCKATVLLLHRHWAGTAKGLASHSDTTASSLPFSHWFVTAVLLIAYTVENTAGDGGL